MGQIEETLKQLQQGVQELQESEKYKRYLETMSKFYNYSVNNILLICMQMPDATRVASYTCWRDKFHRQVLKGEKGLTIIAPTPYKKKYDVEVVNADGTPALNPDGTPIMEQKEIEHMAFRICKVFDVSQTEGKPLPEIVSELINPVENFSDYLSAIREIAPVPVRFDNVEGGAKGYYSPTAKEIVIKRGMPEEQTIKTLLHECAHARLGHGSKEDMSDRSTQEIQAESVAFCCCKALGLDTSEYSFGYIAGWASTKEVKELTESLQVIREQAEHMISNITEKMQQLLELRQEKSALPLLVDKPAVVMKM